CHDPQRGYGDGRVHDGLRTPSLLNCVYNDHQFADGRAAELEEVIGPSPVDEPGPAGGAFRHAWGGVERLRKDESYRKEFREAFGCEPTQDAAAKALATYLRTLLSGNSLHDRALAAQPNKGTLEQADYRRVLDDPKTLTDFRRLTEAAGVPGWQDADARAIAEALHAGYR